MNTVKSWSAPFQLKLSDQLRRRIRRAAHAAGQSSTQWIVTACMEKLEKGQK